MTPADLVKHHLIPHDPDMPQREPMGKGPVTSRRPIGELEGLAEQGIAPLNLRHVAVKAHQVTGKLPRTKCLGIGSKAI
jgi:hypothetical protein